MASMDCNGLVICIIRKKSKKFAYKYKIAVHCGPLRSNPVVSRFFADGHNTTPLDTLFVFKMKVLKKLFTNTKKVPYPVL